MEGKNIPKHKTCQQCKLRKVRCDGRRGICGNCERLRFNCSFQGSRLSSSKPERLRVRQACNRCHSLKVRCSGNLPSCGRCQKKGRECVYSREDNQHSPSSSPPATLAVARSLSDQQCANPSAEDERRKRRKIHDPDSFVEPDSETIQEAFEIYFRHFYPLPGYAFLHRASLYDRFNRGEVDQCLLLSIVALASCLKEDVHPISPEYGTECLKRAEQTILADLSHPSIIRTQALLLVIRCKMWKGDFSSAFALVAILARFAFVLRLNFENPRVCFLAQETRRRLMWAIYMLDTSWAGGLLEFTTCPVDAIHVNIPCHEEKFELDIRQQTQPLLRVNSQSADLGLLAYNVRVAYLRDKVLRHAKGFAAGSSSPHNIVQGIQKLENELELFQNRISSSSAYSVRNLRLRARSTWLPRFIMLHITWHQCHCDLYRCVSSGLEESIPQSTLRQIDSSFITTCQTRCVTHATEIAKIISALLDLKTNLPVLPLEVSIYAYQCMRMILYRSRNYANGYYIDRETIHSYGHSCLEMVKVLARQSPSVRRIESDLESLIANGVQKLPSPEYPPSPPSSSGESTSHPNPRQILSIHSLINHSHFDDDSDRLTLPPDTHSSVPITDLVKSAVSPLIDLNSRPDNLQPSQALCDDVWLNQNNAFEGAWDGPEIELDIVRHSQGQWDGLAAW
ncbi:hypothetical protein ASPWEDRAFT_181156 [Aspergillus wentii DTO 134E9]|uniref:Zn(2)-C6 fungal-type domain-containing protein n=1 Tax=Aspergillus wentii DTO 134E9 TaxID=1073089 RepID=A0A1L9RY37_ASPWE|nr:uncharacterized protein ASPWEDRAFT_181156 [Aspergillus wentii DTO 134E9]OJJ39794.1 hypothetical protein ASPWEDRAFT_181156 [Aspergillus wentii DTO 134E9]